MYLIQRSLGGISIYLINSIGEHTFLDPENLKKSSHSFSVAIPDFKELKMRNRKLVGQTPTIYCLVKSEDDEIEQLTHIWIRWRGGEFKIYKNELGSSFLKFKPGTKDKSISLEETYLFKMSNRIYNELIISVSDKTTGEKEVIVSLKSLGTSRLFLNQKMDLAGFCDPEILATAHAKYIFETSLNSTCKHRGYYLETRLQQFKIVKRRVKWLPAEKDILGGQATKISSL